MKPGDRVIHPRHPEWGLGEVLPGSAGGRLRIYFVYAGEKLLKDAPLQLVSGEQGHHPLLDHRKSQGPGKGIVRKTIPESIAKFIEKFPQGFSDPEYFRQERDYKVSGHELIRELLGPQELARLMASGDYGEAVARALRVVGATNLIFPNEKMALRKGLKSDEEKRRRFVLCLNDLLYGDSDEETRFKAWSELLSDLDAAKWTNATYFQFLAHPDRYIFCKPIVTQAAADVCNFELNYRSDLNWLTNRSVQRFAEVLRGEIASLNPRDMIDVQSFIWCTAPESD